MLNRFGLAAGLALFAIIAAPLAHAQNPNGPATKGARGGGGGPGGPGGGGPGGGGPGGPGGGGPGGPGGGWGGGFGGPGGPNGNSVERLILNEAVQEDLKVDEKTKVKIKKLGEDATKERTRIRESIPKLAAEQTARQNAAIAEELAANGIIADPKAMANNANGGGRGGRGGNNGGPGGNNQLERQMMNMAMTSLQDKVDAAMLKLLDAKQKARIKQILLQQEGVRAFTNPDPEVVDKLGLTEEQLTAIRDANNQLRGTQRQAMQEFFTSFAAANGIDTNANNNNNGGPGGRGGRGGFGMMANLDDATRAKFDQQMQQLQTRSGAESLEAIGQLLTKAQKTIYNKMIGEKFDLAKLRTAPPRPGAPGTPAAPATAATKGATTPPADTAAAAAKKAARPSLRNSRGDN